MFSDTQSMINRPIKNGNLSIPFLFSFVYSLVFHVNLILSDEFSLSLSSFYMEKMIISNGNKRKWKTYAHQKRRERRQKIMLSVEFMLLCLISGLRFSSCDLKISLSHIDFSSKIFLVGWRALRHASLRDRLVPILKILMQFHDKFDSMILCLF